MGLKQCGSCSEMVDQAKAFCPGCGNAFVEEESREATNFEKMDNTVQLGQTMYNQMLSDMGLNIGKGPPTPEKRIEIIAPVSETPTVPKQASPALTQQSQPKSTKWIILGCVILLIGVLAVIAAALLVYFFWPRIS